MPQPLILAHAFGARYDLPIPLKLFVLGGAVVVVLSFLVAERRTVDTSRETVPTDVTYLRPWTTGAAAWATVSMLFLAFLVIVGITGSQEIPENIVPTTFWLVVWIIVPLTCGILGDWTQAVNPFATLAKLCDRPGLRKALLGSEAPVGWPDKLGWWPAVVLYFLTACGELVFNKTAVQPRVTAIALVIYALVSAFGGLMFGRRWLERGEMFSVLFSTWGRLGFLRFGAQGRRGFAGGLDVPFEPSPSRTAFVLLLLVSVNFDGLISTPHWATVTRNLHLAAPDKSHQLELFATLVFLAIAVVVFAVFGGFAYAAARAAGVRERMTAALADLLPSMLPIAFGYLIAHNLQYVLINSQLLLPLIGNPTGLESWPIHLFYPFNDNFEPHVAFLPNAFYWYFAVVVIIAVHIVAVVIAHRHLTLRSLGRAEARRGEYRWLIAMVAYTMLSLWLIAQPLTKEEKPSSSESSGLVRPAVTAPLVVAAPAP
ncbi:hypothetical protein acdb102_36120 [Acidothermaceae bacterium B102]|nr:hypothetical protein acdb102_36120 [Acidothermaceae bacterium B102]